MSNCRPQSVEGREEALRILREFARLFQQVRQQRVTDKAKEKVAARPSISYAPAAISISEPPELEGLDEHRSGSEGNSTVSEVCLDVLYRAGDIVGVSGGRAGLWFAQIEENLVRQTTSATGRRRETVKYNTERPKVRYFVRTCELASWPLAAAYWGPVAMEEAQAISTSSSGVHFHLRRVTPSAVRPFMVLLLLLSVSAVLPASWIDSRSLLLNTSDFVIWLAILATLRQMNVVVTLKLSGKVTATIMCASTLQYGTLKR